MHAGPVEVAAGAGQCSVLSGQRGGPGGVTSRQADGQTRRPQNAVKPNTHLTLARCPHHSSVPRRHEALPLLSLLRIIPSGRLGCMAAVEKLCRVVDQVRDTRGGYRWVFG